MKFKCAALVYHKNIFDIYQKKWIQKSIDSILHQSFDEFDILELNYDGKTFSIFPSNIQYKKYFWNKRFNTHYEARGFLLHKAFHEMKYDIIFNVQLDKFYHLDRFRYQIDEIKRGYDIISSVNHVSEKVKKNPKHFLNITEYLEDKFYCSQCNCSYPPVYKQIHQLSHNVNNISQDEDLFLNLLKHCFLNMDLLRSSLCKFEKFENIEDYRECITSSIMATLEKQEKIDLIDLGILKKLCHYILLFILMIENNSEITEQLNIRWFIDNNINLIESACVCLNRNVWSYVLKDQNLLTNDIQLWKMLAKTQLKFKIITKVLFKYPEDNDDNDDNDDNMEIDIEQLGKEEKQDIEKFANDLKLFRYRKKCERAERKKRRELQQIEDKLKREIKQQQIQRYKEQLHQKKRQQEFTTQQQRKLLQQKKEQESYQNDRSNRRMLRLQKKDKRRQQLKQMQTQQIGSVQQINNRSYSMSNVREVQL